jgi:hypothetical protein
LPGLNPIERLWLHLRDNRLSHCVFQTTGEIVDPAVTLGIGCSPKRDAFDPCVPILGSNKSAINQVDISRSGSWHPQLFLLRVEGGTRYELRHRLGRRQWLSILTD